MPAHGRSEMHLEGGVTVIGEAVRTILPERAEFLVEITSNAQSAAQALRDNQVKTVQVTQSIAPLGVAQSDVQAISLKVHSVYSPPAASLPPYGGLPLQIAAGMFSQYAPNPVQPEVQFGTFQARNILRIVVREPARIGEIADAAGRAGATNVGGFSFHPVDEASARRAALESAGKDAKMKAESLASVTGAQLGEVVTVTEDIVASNGTYAALRATMPYAFGAGAPETAGELQYYARVSATFRLQTTEIRSS